jgi:hypothetical protein
MAYEDYLEEWTTAFGALQNDVSYLRAYDSAGQELEDRCRRIDTNLATSTRVLGSLELAVRSMESGADRALKQASTKRLKAQLKEVRADYPILAAKQRKAALLDGHAADSTMGQKMQMSSSTVQMQRGSDMLRGALSTIDGIENDADDTLSDLERQRETILSAQDKAKRVGSLQDQARGLVRGMLACDLKMRIALVAIIVVTVLVLATIAFLVLFPWEAVRRKQEDDEKKLLLRL